MRCRCCNKPLPSSTVYRSVLVPHPIEVGKTTTLQVEEDLCNKCANHSRMTFQEETSEEDIILADLGLDITGTIAYD